MNRRNGPVRTGSSGYDSGLGGRGFKLGLHHTIGLKNGK